MVDGEIDELVEIQVVDDIKKTKKIIEQIS